MSQLHMFSWGSCDRVSLGLMSSLAWVSLHLQLINELSNYKLGFTEVLQSLRRHEFVN